MHAANVAAILGTRQGSPRSVRALDPTACIASRLPCTLKEHEFLGVEQYDKVFASMWLTPSTVLAATKCNSVIEWDVVHGTPRTIALPVGRPRPPDSCGMHALAMNPSQTLLCVGGSNPCDGLVLDRSTYRPLVRLEGHTDWIFGTCFLKNEVLLTCGRDCAIAAWDLRELPANVTDVPVVRTPSLIRSAHRLKVRSIQLMPCFQQLASLSADGTVKVWDTNNFDAVTSITLEDQDELVSLAFDEDRRLLAVGSQHRLTFVDPRAGGLVAAVMSPEGWGVRSISFKHNLVTVGNCAGTLRFFDTRSRAAITVGGNRTALQVGKGWLRKDANYYSHHSRSGEPPTHSVYTHAWDDGGARLFVAGGPLLVGLRGSYAAMWT